MSKSGMPQDIYACNCVCVLGYFLRKTNKFFPLYKGKRIKFILRNGSDLFISYQLYDSFFENIKTIRFPIGVSMHCIYKQEFGKFKYSYLNLVIYIVR